VTLDVGVETATIDIDSTGRMWLASDASTSINVRYSDFPYQSWSAPVEVASGVSTDDIAAVIALPDRTIGVLWSNQVTQRFGFRVHADGAPPEAWSADEVPASQSALPVGGGMADDHLNLAVHSDGTLYAAVKTSYDTAGYPMIGLLVRRPSGTWDPLYEVDDLGTRPIVVLNEAQGTVLVAYNAGPGGTGEDIVGKVSPLSTIAFGPRQTLIAGALNNPSSTKQNVTDDLVIIATNSSGQAVGIRQTYQVPSGGVLLTRSAGRPIAADDVLVPASEQSLDRLLAQPAEQLVEAGDGTVVSSDPLFDLRDRRAAKKRSRPGQRSGPGGG
jgi:hypothetical protein